MTTRRKNTWSRPPHFTGEKSSHWKGDAVKYRGIHLWVNKTFGKARLCEYKECVYPKTNQNGIIYFKPKRYEWAIRGEKYTRKFEDWIQLCPSCHRKYDLGIIKV